LSTPTYFNPVAKEKCPPSCLVLPGTLRSITAGVDSRVCGTAGGDRLPSSCPPTTHVASLPTVDIMFNSVVSDDAFFGTLDLTEFYLFTPLETPQYYGGLYYGRCIDCRILTATCTLAAEQAHPTLA
jgi:hypothetical protein